MAEYNYNPPEGNGPPSAGPSGSKGGARIWNVFRSKIVLDELSLRESPQGDTRKQRIEDYAASEYPLIKINDYFVSKGEISYFKIDSTNKIPTITLSLTFATELFLSKNMPKDGDIISIAIKSQTELLKPIRNDYVITSVITNKRNTNLGGLISMTLFGELFIPGFKSFLGPRSIRGTSMEAVKTICDVLNLGFNTNEDNTDDRQVWILYSTFEKFMEEVTRRAWKDEESFYDWWIDIYYNLNFVNVQKQLLASEQSIDEAAIVSNVPKEYYWGSDEDQTVGTAKVFSNYSGFRTTSFFIRNWRPINRSSQITFDFGSSIICNFFEHNNILFEEDEKKYWNIDISPDYDPQKINSHIILRGRPNWDPELNSDEPARANYNIGELYKRSPWLGFQYTVSNPNDEHSQWDGNHHKNYLRAQVHNTINRVELDKLNVDIEVQGINLNIIKGDKVPIVLIKKDRVESLLVDTDFQTADTLEFFYSGWYYVKGFTLSWEEVEVGNILNNFSQTFTLSRREWPAPVPTSPIREEQE